MCVTYVCVYVGVRVMCKDDTSNVIVQCRVYMSSVRPCPLAGCSRTKIHPLRFGTMSVKHIARIDQQCAFHFKLTVTCSCNPF